MDFHIPSDAPPELAAALKNILDDYAEGDLTEKGLRKKWEATMALWHPTATVASPRPSSDSARLSLTQQSIASGRAASFASSADSAAGFDGLYMPARDPSHIRGFSTNSAASAISADGQFPRAETPQLLPPPPPTIPLQKPLLPRQIPQPPHAGFDNLPTLLRHRGKTYAREVAITVLDAKGKEVASITWEKLHLKAEKVAQLIRAQRHLTPGACATLIYRDCDVIEFAVALFGCFLAGVVAVPVAPDVQRDDVLQILSAADSKLLLTTEAIYKQFQKIPADASGPAWPKSVIWWKTDELGTYKSPSRHADLPPLQVPDIAYIEYSRSPIGELRGIVLSHRTLRHQMSLLADVLGSKHGDSYRRAPLRFQGSRHVFLSFLEPRQSTGLILGLLFAVYGGNPLVWLPREALTVSGLYAATITKYQVAVLLADYNGLTKVAFDYQQRPTLTTKKRRIDFGSIRWCLINSLTVRCDTHELLADRWLKPLGCPDARAALAPMLTLYEYGGMVVAMRDWLGGVGGSAGASGSNGGVSGAAGGPSSNSGAASDPLFGPTDADDDPADPSGLPELLIDKRALTVNAVHVMDETGHRVDLARYIRVGGFGPPIFDATLAVVNPETQWLSAELEVGELWVDSPSISGGFWGLKAETDVIFRATCRGDDAAERLYFLRTGLMGFVAGGKVFVLGLYEDRIVQEARLVPPSADVDVAQFPYTTQGLAVRYHYAEHLFKTLDLNLGMMKGSNTMHDFAVFNVLVNGQTVPVVVLETPAANPEPSPENATREIINVDTLEKVAAQAAQCLREAHHLYVYCVQLVAPKTLPRTYKCGRKEIANLVCRRRFLQGRLPAMYVKFCVEKAVADVPCGADVSGGVWSRYMSELRAESVAGAEEQLSGVAVADPGADTRTHTDYSRFHSLPELLAWRLRHTPDELAFCRLDERLRDDRGLSWKRLDARIGGMCQQLLGKYRIKPGSRVLLIYPVSEEYIVAVYACWLCGLVPVPFPPPDVARATEDAERYVGAIRGLDIRGVFVHQTVEPVLRHGPVATAVKRVAAEQRLTLPKPHNSSKYKTAPTASVPRLAAAPQKDIALLWLAYTADGARADVSLTHESLLRMCKVVKETCQLTATRPLLACVRHTAGLGFLQTVALGVYVGASTYLIPTTAFAADPRVFFAAVAQYKVKDLYVTPNMLVHAMQKLKTRPSLSGVANLMVAHDGRFHAAAQSKVAQFLSGLGMPKPALAPLYEHFFLPLVTSRSYMGFEPVTLWLDPIALRQGYVSVVNPANDATAVPVQDSGMVPVSTQVAVVNPETCRVCRQGEFGEIWVCSEAQAVEFSHELYRKGPLAEQQQHGRLADGNPGVEYFRTGDFGFLHTISRPAANGGPLVDMQMLFVLGSIADTFEVMGLLHFAADVERSVEKCHGNICAGGSCVFQIGGYVVVVCEVQKRRFISALVPVIVAELLNKHQLVVDIVAFIDKDKLPRSRLGEKQRRKTIEMWVKKRFNPINKYGVCGGEQALLNGLVMRGELGAEYEVAVAARPPVRG